MFNKTKSPEALAEQERQRAQKERDRAERQAEKDRARAQKERARAERQAQREHEAFLRTPVGLARTAFQRGDQLFQYAYDVESQSAVIVAMIGRTATRKTSDASEILNAVAREGWELVNGSFVFRVQGQPDVAIEGTTVGYYLFRRVASPSV